jgi:hypothetical protein
MPEVPDAPEGCGAGAVNRATAAARSESDPVAELGGVPATAVGLASSPPAPGTASMYWSTAELLGIGLACATALTIADTMRIATRRVGTKAFRIAIHYTCRSTY